jgi:hypothetical protein
LALKSEVFCGICESAPADTTPHKKLRVPLPECSITEARIFLDFIYNNTPVSDPIAAEALTKAGFLSDHTGHTKPCEHMSRLH